MPSNVLMRYLLFLLAASCYGQTCTLYNSPLINALTQSGTPYTFQAAGTNGVDNVSANSARVQYTMGPILTGDLSTFAISGSTVTVTTSVSHNLVVGENIGISGLTGIVVGGGISSVSRSANITTVTTNSPHGLSTGSGYNSFVAIAGVTDATFDISGFIISAPTSTTFTISNSGSNATSSGGTVTYDPPSTTGTYTVLTTPTSTTLTFANSFGGQTYTNGTWSGQSGTVAPYTNAVQIAYATAAQYVANGNKVISGTAGVNYSLFEGTSGINVVAGTILGNWITNLASNGTQYYFAGQASANGGSTWCPEVDEGPVTTTVWTGVKKPTAPNTMSALASPPTVTGTDYTVGVAPCNVGSTAAAQFIDCITNEIALSRTLNIGVGIVPGTPIVLPPLSSSPGGGFYAWPTPLSAIKVTWSGSTGTYTTTDIGGGAVTLTNGELVHVAADAGGANASPINAAQTYSVVSVNNTAHTFQISQDGTNALTLNDTGNYQQYIIPWPITQGWLIVHSTASTSNLPPAGVRLDPVAYGNQLGVLELSAPNNQVLYFGFTSHIYFHDIEVTAVPNAAAASETDPPPTGYLLQANQWADSIWFDQCWLHGAPWPDSVGAAGIQVGGTNFALTNYVVDNINQWRPTDALNSTLISSATFTLNGGSSRYGSATPVYYSPQSATSYIACNPTASGTLSGASGSFYVSLNPSTCAVTVTATTGISVSGSGITVVNAASPDYPRDTNSICISVLGKGCYTQLNVGSGTFNGSVINSWSDTSEPPMNSNWSGSGPAGMELQDGPGPFEFLNGQQVGTLIVGVFKDSSTLNACNNGGVACPYVYNEVNLTVQRNTFFFDPNYFISSATWNGSYWFGRNGPEMKQGRKILYDGNVIGPIYGGIGSGECHDLFTYFGGESGLIVSSLATQDIEIKNETCKTAGAFIQMSGGSINGENPPLGIQRVWIHNNLIDNTNGYLQGPQPYGAGTYGNGIGLTANQDISIQHNTWAPNQAGSGNTAVSIGITQSGSVDIENNIFNYNSAGAAGRHGFAFSTGGQTTPIPAPVDGAQGTALLAYLNNAAFANNVFLCTWSNDQPGSLVQITAAACNGASGYSTQYPASTYWQSLANGVSGVGWYTPGSYGTSGGDYHLRPSSPYISGGHLASDGLSMGADINALMAAQGQVQNVNFIPSTSTLVWFAAPNDSTGCSVDYATTNGFILGTAARSTTTTVNATVGNTGPYGTVQKATLSGHGYYRINCQSFQPTGSF